MERENDIKQATYDALKIIIKILAPQVPRANSVHVRTKSTRQRGGNAKHGSGKGSLGALQPLGMEHSGKRCEKEFHAFCAQSSRRDR